LLAAVGSLAFAGVASAATLFPVDNTTLVADVTAANATGQADTIDLGGGTFTLNVVDNNWYGPNGLPPIASDITVQNGTITRAAAAPHFRIFFVGADPARPETLGYTSPGAGKLTLRSATISGGFAEGGDSGGGGGGLGAGGAIFNQGVLLLNGATLSGNTADGGDGGVGGVGSGAGIGSDAGATGGGGFGSGSFGGAAGGAALNGFGGGGGDLSGDPGSPAIAAAGGPGGTAGTPTGLGGAGGDANAKSGGAGGDGAGGGGAANGTPTADGTGGAFGIGGHAGSTPGSNTTAGGGGGVGGGGGGPGSGVVSAGGGGGGFGGGGASGHFSGVGGAGGFGGGGGGANPSPGAGGFAAGAGGTGSGGGGAGLGGAIFNMQGDATITGSLITANTAIGGSGANNGEGQGGGVYNLNGSATASGSVISANVGGGPTPDFVGTGYDSSLPIAGGPRDTSLLVGSDSTIAGGSSIETPGATAAGPNLATASLIDFTAASVAIAAPTNAGPGGSVTAGATVSNGLTPTGSITFRLFSDSACASQVGSDSVAPLGAAAPTSASVMPPAAGTYYWRAFYSGDDRNVAKHSACNAPGSTSQVSAAAPYAQITQKPNRGHKHKRRGRGQKSTFKFAGPAGAGFLCSLDSQPFESCTSPKVYRGLASGRHTFRVKSVDAAGRESAPQVVQFRVGKTKRH
jgi:hypothetical protein